MVGHPHERADREVAQYAPREIDAHGADEQPAPATFEQAPDYDGHGRPRSNRRAGLVMAESAGLDEVSQSHEKKRVGHLSLVRHLWGAIHTRAGTGRVRLASWVSRRDQPE